MGTLSPAVMFTVTVVLVLQAVLPWHVVASTSLYDYGHIHGDQLACPRDDTSYGPVDLGGGGFPFGTDIYHKAFLTSNGLIAFEGPYMSFTPQSFPFDMSGSGSSSSYNYNGNSYSSFQTGSLDDFPDSSFPTGSHSEGLPDSGFSTGAYSDGWPDSSSSTGAYSGGWPDSTGSTYFDGSQNSYSWGSPQSYGPSSSYSSSHGEMCHYYIDADGRLIFSHRDSQSSHSPSYWHSSSYYSHSGDSSNSHDCNYTDHLPACQEPINYSNSDVKAIVAPFWNDIDPRISGGRLYYRVTNDSNVLERARLEIYDAIGYAFNPTNALVATWEDVQQFSKCNGLENTFQAVLAWDSVDAFVIIKYDKLEWTFGQVGFNNGGSYCELEGSRTNAIEEVLYQSNAGDPGTWIWGLSATTLDITDCYLNISGYDVMYSSSSLYYSGSSYSTSDSVYYSDSSDSVFHNSYSSDSYSYPPSSMSDLYGYSSPLFHSDPYSSSSYSYPSSMYNSYDSSNPSYHYESPSHCSYCSHNSHFSYVSIPCTSHQQAIPEFYAYGPEVGDMEACKYDDIASLNVYLTRTVPYGRSHFGSVYISSTGILSFDKAATSYTPRRFPIRLNNGESSSQWYNSGGFSFSSESSSYNDFISGYNSFSDSYNPDHSSYYDPNYPSSSSPYNYATTSEQPFYSDSSNPSMSDSYYSDIYSHQPGSIYDYSSSSYYGNMCWYYIDENGNYTLPYPMHGHENHWPDCDFSRQGINSWYCHYSDYNHYDLDEDMVAVLWGDTHIGKGYGKMFLRETSELELLQRVSVELQNVTGNVSWHPHSAVVATWEDLHNYEFCNKTASFQAVLAWDDYSSYILMKYHHIEWPVAHVGFSTKENDLHCNMLDFNTPDTSHLLTESNVGAPSTWGLGLNPNTFNSDQCHNDVTSFETTTPATYETTSQFSTPSASFVPCKEYSSYSSYGSSYSSDIDHYSHFYGYGYSFFDDVACPVDDESFGPLEIDIDGIKIGSEVYHKIYVTSNGVISFKGPYNLYTPRSFPFHMSSSDSDSSYNYSGNSYSSGSDNVYSSHSYISGDSYFDSTHNSSLDSSSWGDSFNGWSGSDTYNSGSYNHYSDGSYSSYSDSSNSYGPHSSHGSSYEDMCYYYHDADGNLVFSHRSYSHSSSDWLSSNDYSHSWHSSSSGDCYHNDYLPGCQNHTYDDNYDQADAMIAVFWTDIDLRLGEGKMFYRLTNESEILNRAMFDIHDITADNMFSPTNALVVTWENVQEFATCNGLENTFQAVLVWDSSSAYVIMNYGELEYGRSQVGFNTGDYFCELPGSRTNAIQLVSFESNTGLRGQHLFGLSDTNVDNTECYMDISGYELMYSSSFYSDPSNPTYSSPNNYESTSEQSYSFSPFMSDSYPSASYSYPPNGMYDLYDHSSPLYHSDPYSSSSYSYPSSMYNSYDFSNPSYHYESPSHCSYCSYNSHFSYIPIPCVNHQHAIREFYPYGPEVGDMEACKYDSITSLTAYLAHDIPFGSAFYSTVIITSSGVLSFEHPITSVIPQKFPLMSGSNWQGHSSQGYSHFSSFGTESSHDSSFGGDQQSSDSYTFDSSVGSSFDMCYYYPDADGNYTLTSPMSTSSYQHSDSTGYDCDFTKQGTNSHYCYTGHYHYSDDLTEDMVAVFWAGTDIRRGKGKMYLRVTTDTDILSDVADKVQNATGNAYWYPHTAVVATWEGVHYYENCDNKTASFQAVLSSNGDSTYILMKYHHIDWPMGQVGFNTATEGLYCDLPGSRTSQITEVVNQNDGTWVMGVTLETYDSGQCNMNVEIDSSSSATYESSNTYSSSVPSGSWLPCKHYSSIPSLDWSSLNNMSSWGSYDSSGDMSDWSSSTSFEDSVGSSAGYSGWSFTGSSMDSSWDTDSTSGDWSSTDSSVDMSSVGSSFHLSSYYSSSSMDSSWDTGSTSGDWSSTDSSVDMSSVGSSFHLSSYYSSSSMDSSWDTGSTSGDWSSIDSSVDMSSAGSSFQLSSYYFSSSMDSSWDTGSTSGDWSSTDSSVDMSSVGSSNESSFSLSGYYSSSSIDSSWDTSIASDDYLSSSGDWSLSVSSGDFSSEDSSSGSSFSSTDDSTSSLDGWSSSASCGDFSGGDSSSESYFGSSNDYSSLSGDSSSSTDDSTSSSDDLSISSSDYTSSSSDYSSSSDDSSGSPDDWSSSASSGDFSGGESSFGSSNDYSSSSLDYSGSTDDSLSSSLDSSSSPDDYSSSTDDSISSSDDYFSPSGDYSSSSDDYSSSTEDSSSSLDDSLSSSGNYSSSTDDTLSTTEDWSSTSGTNSPSEVSENTTTAASTNTTNGKNWNPPTEENTQGNGVSRGMASSICVLMSLITSYFFVSFQLSF